MAIEATAPDLAEGMWYSDDIRDFARAQGVVVSPLLSMPGRVPGDDFARLPRRFGLYALILKPHRSAARALRLFLRGPTITECGNWLLALQYEALLAAVGDDRFDAWFGGSDNAVAQTRRLQLNHPNFGPLQPLWREMAVALPQLTSAAHASAVQPDIAVSVGDIVHFAGVPGYHVKHPLGVAGGWNLVCCEIGADGPLYAGQGIGKPCTAEAMAAQLVREYNAPRTAAEHAVALLHPFKHGMTYNRVRARVPLDIRRPPGITRLWRFVPEALEDFGAASAFRG